MDLEHYRGREQTYVKHYVLKHYLQKLAYKVGSWKDEIVYVDCFAGPWRHQTEDLGDTSPFIAMNELRSARDTLLKKKKRLGIRCLFIEQDPAACETLQEKIKDINDLDATAIEGSFEDNIPRIVEFCNRGPAKSFRFFFIDPTGWNGISPGEMSPLLRLDQSEVLINFMTQHISRFADSRSSDKSIEKLFGSLDVRKEWEGLEGRARDDRIVETYAERIRQVGDFEFVVPTVVLNPLKDRTHFHLIYATHHPEGLRTFRNDVERLALKKQDVARLEAHRIHEETTSGQTSLFSLLDQPTSASGSYLEDLQKQYMDEMKSAVLSNWPANGVFPFDELELFALRWPFVNSSKLKEWLKQLRQRGQVTFEGLGERERALKTKKGHCVSLEVDPSKIRI